jgi:hypothetical protein
MNEDDRDFLGVVGCILGVHEGDDEANSVKKEARPLPWCR